MAASKTFPDYCQLTFETEGGKLPAVLRPHCPGSSSGVTIGPGYDMKERKAADVKADLEAAGVPTDVAEKLSGGVGKSGDTAKTWISENFTEKGAVITTDASANLFTHVYPVYSDLVKKKVSEEWAAPWDQLPTKMKELLVDLAFRGDMSRFKGSATKHEKLLKPPVVANDFAAFKKVIQDYEYWKTNTNLPDMKDGSANGRITARGAWLDGPDSPAGGGVNFPLDLGGGTAPVQASTDAYYKHTEIDNKGGYFPIGVNTVWHGGVHLRAKKGTPVRALWDGKLVAARLPDDAAKAIRHYGSVNFVLLAHEVSGAILNKLAPKGKLTGYKVRVDAVKLRKTASTKAEQLATLGKDDELERLDDKAPEADGYTWAFVKVKTSKTAAGKQGYVAIKAEWYLAVREEKQVTKLDETKTYTFHSLYMHLNNEPLDGTSKALDEVRWLHAAPATPSTDTLAGTVGDKGANAAADVTKVQGRLKEHGYYSGAATGTVDAATQAAIGKFQDQLVKDKVIKAADGVISPGGKTWKGLQAAPRSARPKLDAGLVDKLRGGGVVALDKTIRGGDVLWTSGVYGSSDYRAELMHWEIFSKDPLVPGWATVDDSDDDFNLDCAQIVGMIQQDDGWWDNDAILTLDEIVRFYTTHPSAKLLRNYACKFISEWAINLDIAIPKMLDAGMISTYGLKDRMSPYLWWTDAGKAKVALPDPKCWHYNPIAFASALASAVPASSGAPAESAPAAAGDKELSGAPWVSRFPTSRSITDLANPFQTSVTNFVAALKAAGAGVSIAATRRPPERAHLMRYSWDVANGTVKPNAVPAKAGVNIEWDHGNDKASIDAAKAMVSGYEIAYRPSLTSRHIESLAIDMSISWSGTLNIVDASGTTVAISSTPRTGAGNTDLHAVGAGYGVHKLVSDPPHWSSDGH